MPDLVLRLRILGIVLLGAGLLTAGFSVLYGYRMADDGLDAAQAMYEQEGVRLDYDDEGRLVDDGSPEAAQAILDRLEDEWKYPVKRSDLDPDDPVVNTRSELMYQYATITEHVLHQNVSVNLTARDVPITYRGITYDAPGLYNITVGEPYAELDRTNPIERQLRAAWSPLALALLAALSSGHANQAAGEIAQATTLGFAGIGLLVALAGGGLLWTSFGATRPPKHPPAP